MPIATPRPAFLSSRHAARMSPTHHQFVPGLGYVAHGGPPELPRSATGAANCAPPDGTTDGTLHMMQPSNGHPPIAMTWHARSRAWGSTKPEKGNRLAWPVDYLMRAGWAYVGPAPVIMAAAVELP